jgi:sugar lactone lactonase YvrE
MITVSMLVEVVTRGSDALGEGPVWLASERQLVRVDVTAPAIVRRDVAARTEERTPVGAHVGFALPTSAGGLVAGVGREVHLVQPSQALAAVEPDRPENRFNDAGCDARGRLWAGTMSTTRCQGAAALYRLMPDGQLSVALDGVTISNGLDWNRDATLLYYVDSTTQRVDAIDFDLDRGRLGRRRTFATIAPEDGLPDGLTVDAEGGVWLALFGGSAIRRYSPDGRLDAELRLPVTNPTSMAFAGPDLGDLYITSARHRLGAEQLAQEPLAGSLLRVRPGVRGRLPRRFGDT